MNVVCFGQQNWDYCWTGKQQLMTRLAQRGHRVLYVDPQSIEDVAGPVDSLRALAPIRTGFGIRELAPGLFVYTHHHAPALRWRVNHWLRPHRLAALARRLGFEHGIALAHHPSAESYIGAVQPSARVYYAVDEATAFGTLPMEEQRGIRAAEERLVHEADVVLAISPRLYGRLSALHPRTYLLASAADVDHFSPAHLARVAGHPAVISLPRPRLGFVGQIDERIDQELLATLARARPDWQIVLAGRVKLGVDVSTLFACPNIHLLGHQPYEQLPSVLREIDVCLAPYRLTPLTHACSPLKVYEYLATGRPVVATPVNALVTMRGEVALADTADRFRAAVESALRDPAAGRQQRLAFATDNNWDSRVDELERRLAEAIALHPSRPRLVRPSRARAMRGYSGARGVSSSTDPALRAEEPSRGSAVAFRLSCALGCVYYALRVSARLLTGRRPVAVRRILVARRTRLGDLVVFLPTLEALRQRYPDARIVLGVQRGMSAGALLHESTDIDEVRELDHLDQSSRVAQLMGAMRLFAEGFDLVVSGARYFLLREALLSGAPRRIGLDDGHPLQRWNNGVIPFDATRHEADNNLALVEALGARIPGAVRVPHIALTTAAADGVTHLFETLAIPADAPVLTIHPGSQKPSHRWPAERFAELACRLLAERRMLHIVFSAVPDEAPLVEGIRAALPTSLRERALDSMQCGGIPTLVGLLHRSAACLSNDTGVMHLARACGTPLVALLGAEEDRRWGPYPLGSAPAVALRYRVPCAPCVRWSCDPLYCLRSITVNEVFGAVSHLLDTARARTHSGAATDTSGTLERHVSTRTWEALSQTFDVPLVTVVVLAAAPPADGTSPRFPDGGELISAAARDVHSGGALNRTITSIAQQSYPRIEVIVAESCDGSVSGERSVFRGMAGALPIETVHVRRGPLSKAAWETIVRSARGALVVPVLAGATLDRGKVADDVARLVRVPAEGGQRDGWLRVDGQ